MSGILLIGTDGGKRRFYFEQAAAEAGLPVVFLDWKDVPDMGHDEGFCPEKPEELETIRGEAADAAANRRPAAFCGED